MSHVKFTADYDHKWPSGCVTAFKKGWEGTVKAEVTEAAVKARKAVDLDAKGKAVDRSNNQPPAQAALIAEKNEIVGMGPTDPKDV